MGMHADRTNTALLVIDVQIDVMSDTHERDEVVARIVDLVDRAREKDVPILWIQHNDADLPKNSTGWDLVEELNPKPHERRIHKSYNDAFEETSLDSELAALGVGRLVVMGARTEWCVRATLHGAIARGYDALLVSDAHTTGDMSEEIPASSIIEMTNTYWRWHSVPGRKAGVAHSSEITFDA
jgi:nicotinamidase-related amidase